MQAIDEDEFPVLTELLGWYFAGVERKSLDSDAQAEKAVSSWPEGRLDVLREEIARAIEVLAAQDVEEGGRWLSLFCALPVGSSYAEWLRYLDTYLPEFWPHRRPQTNGRDGILLPKITTFVDKATANAAASAVNHTHAGTLRAWADDLDSPWRLHLYADLGTGVGHQIRREDVEAYQAGSAPPPVKHPVTGCVVLFRKDPQTREPFIAVTYPERSLPTDARDRYPDLPLLFGGYFGQDYTELDDNRWAAERNVNGSTPPAVKHRIASQLAELLTQDDDTLRRDVEALGSYVLPDAMRRWVTGLHRRMTRIDWSRA